MDLSLENAELLMQELGPGAPDVDVVVRGEDNNWAVQLDDESIVLVEWLDNPLRLLLSLESAAE